MYSVGLLSSKRIVWFIKSSPEHMCRLGLNPGVTWSETSPSLRFFWDCNTVLQIGPTSVKALSMDKLAICDPGTDKRRATYSSDIVTVETAELQPWCPRVRPAARRGNNRCLFAILWFCFPFLLCLLLVLSQAFLSRYPTFFPSSLLSLNDVFCVWLSVLLPTLLAFVLCLRLLLLGLPSPL